MFESVDLPAPFSPSRACTSPSEASKSTRSLATTPGNRFVIPRRVTAVGMERAGRDLEGPVRQISFLALRASDDALDEPVDGIQLLERQPLTLLDPELPALVVDRAAELVPLPALDQRLLLRNQGLRLRRDTLAVRGEQREPILQAPVVVARLPGAVHRGLDARQVVRAPVVDRAREPRLRRELLGVRVIADPRHACRLRVLAGCRAVDVLAEHVGARGLEVLGGRLLLDRSKPGVRPTDHHLRARMRLLHTTRECVRV